MGFLSIAHTDVGIKKAINQDSVLIQTADTDFGEVLFAVICDGMGGLANGELASATMIRAFSGWFENTLPGLLYAGGADGQPNRDDLEQSLYDLIQLTNQKITNYGLEKYVSLGTTAVTLLLVGDTYYILNVGDSRVYQIDYSFTQLTKDQTFVQREMELGNMTPEQARIDPQRNVLLQCIGASPSVVPDYYSGKYERDTVFMLCSDGFRHLIEPEEFFERMRPEMLQNEQQMTETAVYFTELNKSRYENDNISVVLIRASEG